MEEGFNKDHFLKEEVANLIKMHGVRTAIETGTNTGNTTILLSEMAETVHTIELKESVFDKAKRRLSCLNNVLVHQGNSPKVLDELLPSVERPCLFYLDAHWYNYWPLRDELAVIAKHGLSDSVIVIHDFQVPGKPEFGFDRYKGVPLNFNYVQEGLKSVYGDGNFHHYYNDRAAGAKRGVLFVVPEKKS